MIGPLLEDYNVSATRVLRRGGGGLFWYAYGGYPVRNSYEVRSAPVVMVHCNSTRHSFFSTFHQPTHTHTHTCSQPPAPTAWHLPVTACTGSVPSRAHLWTRSPEMARSRGRVDPSMRPSSSPRRMAVRREGTRRVGLPCRLDVVSPARSPGPAQSSPTSTTRARRRATSSPAPRTSQAARTRFLAGTST